MSGQEKKGMFGRLFGVKSKVASDDAPELADQSEVGSQALDEIEQTTQIVDPTDKEDAGDIESDLEAGSLLEEEAQALDPKMMMGESLNEGGLVADDSSNGLAKEDEKKGWFSRLKAGLSKSSSKLSQGISDIFTKSKLDDQALEDLEDLLIQSDLGVAMAVRITEQLASSRYDKEISNEDVRAVLAREVAVILEPVAKPLTIDGGHKPHILLMVGVNGAGKTTTIGKLAQKFRQEGKSVMMAAGDTFRAAAIDQLKVWGERTGAVVVAGNEGADASGLVYEALQNANDQKIDVLMIDTAGRLQNKANLMAELEKIVRVIKKFDPTGPHDVLLTLDATTGQNALNQVEVFEKTAGVSGLIMTKLDGTARGGILVAIADKYKLPIHAIGVGERIEDMQPFEPEEFAKAIADL